MHSLVIGPGMGREIDTLQLVKVLANSRVVGLTVAFAETD